MIKTKKIGFFLVFSLLFMISILYSSNRYASSAETTNENDYKFVFNGTERSRNTEYELKNDQLLLNITKEGGWPNGTTVKWESSERSVVDLEIYDPTQTQFIRLKRKGPGFSTITATINTGSTTFSISCRVKVDLLFDVVKSGLVNAKTTNSYILQLDTIGSSKTIYLKYIDYGTTYEGIPTASGSAITYDNVNVSFSSDNEDVAKVNEKTGEVTAMGSGSAIITVTSNTMSTKDTPMVKTIMAVVKPTFTIDLNKDPIPDPASVDSYIGANPVLGVPSTFVLQSKAKFANYLRWEVRVAGTKTALKPDGKLLNYEVSDVSGNVYFSKVKAGTYEIFAFANKDFVEGTNAPYAYMKIVVPFHMEDQDIIMNVGDTYSILENSNFPDMDIFNVYSGSQVVIRVDDKDIITARKKGETTVVLDYIGDIYDEHLINDDTIDNQLELRVKVIDGIALSTTQATIFTSGTFLLKEIVTDNTQEIIWKSSDTSVATVSKGLVTAGTKPGVTIITAQQKINGITKTASCEITVQQSVSKITVDPDEVHLEVDEYATLHADITPATLSGVVLTWRSSNTSVVEIDKPNALTTTIKGVGGGNAVVSAINQDNVVVGYSHIYVRKAVERIVLSETKVTVPLNTSRLQLRASVEPEDASNKEISWSSTDTAKATVDTNGLVTLKQPGTVTIVATSVDNPSVRAYCNITIEIPVTSVALDETTKTMYVGQAARLTYILLPANASKNSVTWTSTNTAVATVDATGMVTAKGVGTTVIMLKTLDGSKSVYCTITVRQVATGIKFQETQLTLQTGERYYMNVELTPANSTDNGLLWESSDTKVVTVNEKGMLEAKEAGTAIIMARTESGGMAYCKVTVLQAVKSLIMNFEEKTIYVGDDFELTVSINPSKATQLAVTWKSSNTKVATVTDKGIVKGLKGGTAVITATTVDGGYSAICVVTVREKISGLKLNYDSYRLGLDKSVILIATATNENATNQKIVWTSSNEKVAKVSKTGKVIGIKYGFATITAYAQDGSNAEASCEIEVVKAVTRVSLDKSYLSMLVGEGKELNATLEPKSATYNKVNWITSNDKVAIVDQDGYVTALSAGTATITAQAADSSGKKAICYITVSERVPSTGITVMDKKLVMISGEEKIVQVSINPVASTDRYTWSSDNSSVAKVDKKTGKITARATGTANLTVMTDSGKMAVIEITVIGLSVNKLELEQYTEYVLYVEGASGPVKWDISNPEVAVVTNGRVSTRAKGTAIITATINGRKLKCTLKVTKIR